MPENAPSADAAGGQKQRLHDPCEELAAGAPRWCHRKRFGAFSQRSRMSDCSHVPGAGLTWASVPRSMSAAWSAARNRRA